MCDELRLEHLALYSEQCNILYFDESLSFVKNRKEQWKSKDPKMFYEFQIIIIMKIYQITSHRRLRSCRSRCFRFLALLDYPKKKKKKKQFVFWWLSWKSHTETSTKVGVVCVAGSWYSVSYSDYYFWSVVFIVLHIDHCKWIRILFWIIL